MANISVTYSFSNGSTADATEVNTNFQDIIDGTSDGSKDFSISALTCAGNATFNANTTIGNATSDDLTVTARVASDVIPKTDSTSDLGSTSLRWAQIWVDDLTSGGTLTAATCDLDGAVTINDSGASVDFRVESDTDTHAVFVDGSANQVMMGTSSAIINAPTNYYPKLAVHCGAEIMPLELYTADGSANDSIMKGYSDNGGSQTNNVIIQTDGDLQNTNNSYGAISDLRMKENIEDSPDYLDRLNQVRIIKYSLKREKLDAPNRLGVIAQEIEKIFPTIIKENKDGMKAVKYSVLVPILVKAVQELTAKVEKLEAS